MKHIFFILLVLVQHAFCEFCVKYTFEDDDFEELFSQELGMCVNFRGLWRTGTYDEVPLSSPHPLSTRFIYPSSAWSCIASFLFLMSPGGVIEVNMYMDQSDSSHLTHLIVIEPPNHSVSQIAVDVKIQGWHTARLSIPNTQPFEGYLIILTRPAPTSNLIVDSFRYIPPGMDERDCKLYEIESTSTESTNEITTEITTENSIQSTTDSASDSTTESGTESGTESTSESITESLTDSTTEAVTEATIGSTTVIETIETATKSTIATSTDISTDVTNPITTESTTDNTINTTEDSESESTVASTTEIIPTSTTNIETTYTTITEEATAETTTSEGTTRPPLIEDQINICFYIIIGFIILLSFFILIMVAMCICSRRSIVNNNNNQITITHLPNKTESMNYY